MLLVLFQYQENMTEQSLLIETTKWNMMELIIVVIINIVQQAEASKNYIFKPHGLKSKPTAGLKLIISQQNENNQRPSSHILQVQSN